MKSGCYRFHHLPFRIISEQDGFQHKIDDTNEGLDGVTAIMDDTLVYRQNKEKHDTNLHMMLQCLAWNVQATLLLQS